MMYADFLHLAWSCRQIQSSWLDMFGVPGEMLDMWLEPDVRAAMLWDDQQFTKPQRRFAVIAMVLASGCIVLDG